MNIQVFLRFMLVFTALAMMVVAMAYLRRKSMNWGVFLFWGLLAIGLPYIGPFLVIALRAGQNGRQYKTPVLNTAGLE
jgi:hypothetical protein